MEKNYNFECPSCKNKFHIYKYSFDGINYRDEDKKNLVCLKCTEKYIKPEVLVKLIPIKIEGEYRSVFNSGEHSMNNKSKYTHKIGN